MMHSSVGKWRESIISKKKKKNNNPQIYKSTDGLILSLFLYTNCLILKPEK